MFKECKGCKKFKSIPTIGFELTLSYILSSGTYYRCLILSQNIEAVSLFPLGYHWLSLATSYLVGDYREFEV